MSVERSIHRPQHQHAAGQTSGGPVAAAAVRGAGARLERNAGLLVLIATLAAFGLRVYRLGFQSLWYDESYGAYWAKKPLLEILTNTSEFHPPGYYALLWLQYRLAGDSEFALRFVGVLFGVALVPIVYVLGRRLGGTLAGLVAAGLTALSPMLVVYAQELRMYAPQATVAALSTLVLWDAVHRGGALRWLAYTGIAGAALYLDYFPGMVLAAQGLALFPVVLVQALRKGRWGRLAAFAGAQLAAIALFAPWLRVLLSQAQSYGAGGRELQVTPGGILADLWVSFLTGTNLPLPYGEPALWLAALGAVLAIAGLLVAARSRPGAVAFAVALVVIPVAIMIGAVMVRPFYHARFLLVMLPHALVLFGIGAAALRIGSLRTLGAPALCLLPAALLGLTGYYFDPRLAKLDARSPAEFLAQHATADDLVFWGAQSPLAYYYRGPARLEFFSVYPDSISERLGAAVDGRRWVWWEASNLVDNDPTGLVPWLLTRAGRQLGDGWIGGYNLRWWEAADASAYQMPELTELGWRFEHAAIATGGAYGPAEGISTVPADGFVWVKLAFDVLEPGPSDLKFYVRLVSADGTEAGRTDGWIRNWDHRPTSVWTGPGQGEAYALLRPAPGTPPGHYTVWAGLYRADGPQITLTGGATAEGRLGEVEITAPRGAVELPPHARRVDPVRVAGNSRVLSLEGIVPVEGAATVGERRTARLYWRVTGEPAASAEELRVRVGNFETAAPAGGRVDVSEWPEGALLAQDVAARGASPGLQTVELLAGGTVVPLGRLEVLPRPAPPTLPEGLATVEGRLEQGTEVAGYRLTRDGEQLSIEVYWRAGAAFAGPRQSFVQALDGGGRLVAQADGPLGEGAISADALLPGDILVDRRTLTLPPGGPYRLIVGIYEGVTGQREPVATGGDFIPLGTVE